MMQATYLPLSDRFASMPCNWPSLPSLYARIILAFLGYRRVLNLKTSFKQKKVIFTHWQKHTTAVICRYNACIWLSGREA